MTTEARRRRRGKPVPRIARGGRTLNAEPDDGSEPDDVDAAAQRLAEAIREWADRVQ